MEKITFVGDFHLELSHFIQKLSKYDKNIVFDKILDYVSLVIILFSILK